MKKRNIPQIDFAKLSQQVDKMRSKNPRIPLNPYASIDLIPPSHKNTISLRKTRKTTFYSGMLIVGLCMIALLFNGFLTLSYKSQISSEKKIQASLAQENAAYTDVDKALQDKKLIDSLTSRAAGNEIDWVALTNNIQSNLSPGTYVSSYSVINGGLSKDKSTTAVTLNLSSDSTLSYSDIIKSFENTPGIKNVQIGGLSQDSDGRYIYKVSFTYDNSILTNRFTEGE